MDPVTLRELEDDILVDEFDGDNNKTRDHKFVKPETSMSSSASSVYSTAEEDFEGQDETDVSLGVGVKEPLMTATKTWVTGVKKKASNKSNNKIPSPNNKSSPELLETFEIEMEEPPPIKNSNLTLSSQNPSSITNNANLKNTNMIMNTTSANKVNPKMQISSGNPNKVNNDMTISNVLRDPAPSSSSFPVPGPSFQRFSTASSDDEDDFRSFSDSLISEGKVITVQELQTIFDYFKSPDLAVEECERLIDILGVSQNRNDFQWALYQLGGFNALLFLYARVVEICENDEIQSKGLSLVLTQIKNHSKSTDSHPKTSYNLLRFVLNSEKSSFGFKTFIILVHHCLTPSGNRLLDYDLLESCLLSSWRTLTSVRCTEAEAPTGKRSLFECLLTVILDLLLEKNVHRALNIATLKSQRFTETLLAICYNMIFDNDPAHKVHPQSQSSSETSPSSSGLSSMDALRISALVKSIFSELMAPPDAYVAIALVKCGLYPLLPRELPPLPRKEDAFFVFQNKNPTSTNMVSEAEEVSESHYHDVNIKPVNKSTSSPQLLSCESTSPVVSSFNEDIPEILGRVLLNNNKSEPKIYLKESFERSQYDGFRETFQESLAEALMTVLLNTLAIIPDGSFFSVLRPHLTSHIFVAYCSHSNTTLKILSLKLLSSYLSRVKNPCVTEFLRSKGFYLASLFIQNTPETCKVVSELCSGFGPVSYPLLVSLTKCNETLSTVLDWAQEDESNVIPGLLSMGFIPCIMNQYKSSQSISRPLSTLISYTIRYCSLNPKDDPWKILFCPALESSPHTSHLTGRFFQESTEYLKNYRSKELKKGDANTRLLWLLERCCTSRFGSHFDKWLLNLYTHHIMDPSNEDPSEVWKYFVKKNKKRLHYLMGVFLCKIFAPNRGELDFKTQVLRSILLTCPNARTWIPKVIRSDEAIERSFTAFFRIFISNANQKESAPALLVRDEDGGGIRSPSFQSLMSDSNSALSYRIGSFISSRHSRSFCTTTDDEEGDSSGTLELSGGTASETIPGHLQLPDKTIRENFEEILVDAGILSPTSNFSTFSPDFKNFKILLERPPICGVSYHELRQCLMSLDKMKVGLLKSHLHNQPIVLGAESGSKVMPSRGFYCNAVYFEMIFEAVAKLAVVVLDTVTRVRTEQELELVRMLCTREEDVIARSKWWSLQEQMGHPKAPWFFPDSYPKFWALDQSEGPGRVRVRLCREHLKLNSRFVMPKYRAPDYHSLPLEYLFQSDTDDQLMTFPHIKSEIQFMRFCTRIIPGEEIFGEIILCRENLYFIPDASKCESEQFEHVELPLSSVVHTLRRRYTLEDRAAEIFVGNRSLFFVFRNTKDREEFLSLVNIRGGSSSSTKSYLMESSLTTMTSQWAKGLLSNFEYLMYLNTAAGRTYCDLMQYPVFPFVLAKYDSPTLDLHAPQSYRDLKKPMAIQDPSKEEHFLATYNYLKRECDSAPFHYGSHYSNSGIVLHFLIRLPPYTQHFLRYQDGSFDIPDRSFHNIDTTWRLASRESNTDFKECIPEFFYLPEFLKNLQHFDFGVRQNGKRVDDVVLPPWAKGDARLFTLINRQALESNQVRKFLSDWIDLIFGFKQMGKAAIAAINVFHPSTYEGFEVDGVGDELMKKARKAMVSTYGQTPKKLFPFPHPRSTTASPENCEMEVLDTVWGIRWGHFLGSPTCYELEVVNTREYTEPMELFENPTRIVFWPGSTLIMGDSVVGHWKSGEIRVKSKTIYVCIGDEISAVSTTDATIWVGHQSGRITVLRLSKTLEKVLETSELVGHYKAIKNIDLNSDFSTAVSCSGEDYAIVWDMNKTCFLNVIQRPDSVDSVYSSRSTGDIALVSLTSNSVTLTTINGFEVGTVQPEEKVECACISSLDPGKNVNLLAVGCDYGYIRFYSTWDLKFINQIKVIPFASLPIQRIRYSNDGRRLYCLSRNEEISISAALQLPDSPK